MMGELYAPFTRQGGNRVLFMDIASAEVTKYAANAMLATRISFMNQMARFCELVGADVNNVRLGIGSDQRIGRGVPLSGPRLRRLLLSQGREGDHPHRRFARPVARRAQGGRGRQRGPEAGGPAQDAQVRRQGPERQDRRHLGPRLQGRDRRHAREPDHSAHRGAARGGRPGPDARPQGDGVRARRSSATASMYAADPYSAAARRRRAAAS